MSPDNLDLFRLQAAAEYPKEACGLLANVGGVETYFACRNLAETPEAHFKVSPEDYLNASLRGEIVAVCHTHPNVSARPSEGDRAACEASGLPWYVLSWPTDELVRITPCGFKAPLIGREFVHGVHDCYSLIRDYYQETLAITLPDFARDELWWEKGQNLYEDNFAAAGFRQVVAPQAHDVILMRVRAPTSNHAGVLMQDLALLQHLFGHLSGRTVYGGYWQRNTTKILRHESQA